MRKAPRTPTRGLKRLIDWATKRKRPTVIAFFGDHLPPLGPVYVETGFMKEPVAPRKGAARRDEPRARDAAGRLVEPHAGRSDDIGAISPAFLPLHILRAAGITHPYYTGFLGEVRERYRVVDRNMLVDAGQRDRSRTGRGSATSTR